MWRELLDFLVDQIFPEACALCETAAAVSPWVCPSCIDSSPPPPPPLALSGTRLGQLRTPGGTPPIVYPATHYTTDQGVPAAAALRLLKFGGRRRLAGPLARLILDRVRLPPGALVPVPLHPARLRTRGYDQARLLATHLGRLAGRPVIDGVLRRIRNTAPQSRLAAADRRINARNAFVQTRALPDKTPIVLVDDVVTTGATLCACVDALPPEVPHVTAVVVARSLRVEADSRTG